MALKVYYTELSPPSRAVLVAVRSLGLDAEYINVNLLQGEQHDPEYLKLNPQHTVPTIKDGDFAIWDSHAISAYLVDKYGKDDSLYPKDLQKRAVVDQRLHFDSGVVFPRLSAIVAPIFREGAKSVPKDKANAVGAAYSFLEAFLKDNKFVAGDTLTLADFNLGTNITQLNVLVPIASNRYPEITRWLNDLKETSPLFNEINQPAIDKFDKIVKATLK